MFVGILLVVAIFQTLCRIWVQRRARNWPAVPGKFKQGAVVRVVRGRYNDKVVYSVCIDYDYSAGESSKASTVALTYGNFPPVKEQRHSSSALKNRSVSIRVAPDKPATSYILDEDVAFSPRESTAFVFRLRQSDPAKSRFLTRKS